MPVRRAVGCRATGQAAARRGPTCVWRDCGHRDARDQNAGEGAEQSELLTVERPGAATGNTKSSKIV